MSMGVADSAALPAVPCNAPLVPPDAVHSPLQQLGGLCSTNQWSSNKLLSYPNTMYNIATP